MIKKTQVEKNEKTLDIIEYNNVRKCIDDKNIYLFWMKPFFEFKTGHTFSPFIDSGTLSASTFTEQTPIPKNKQTKKLSHSKDQLWHYSPLTTLISLPIWIGAYKVQQIQ